jgi:3-oxoacyl-[acyl-carrier protein] reductase
VLTLEGRSALVTGGSRGIGRAVCELFAQLGARVAVNFLRGERAARQVVEAIQGAGGEAVALRADVSVPAEAAGLVEQTVARFGALDVLVVNHGIWKRAPIQELSPEQWEETLGVNLRGAYAVCAAAARHMVPRGSGNIVLVASTAGQRGEARYSHYAASKGALLAFTRSLAAELAPSGIRVNAVAPGWVLTDMTRDALEGPEGPEALARIPRRTPGTPLEVAGPIAFLASGLASYVCGEVLCVNGGAVMVG